MRDQVLISIDVLKPLAHRHRSLVLVLLKWENDGKCWPSLRTIAREAGETLSWVQRNLAECESLGYFETIGRTRKGGSFIRQLAARFVAMTRWKRSPANRTPKNPSAEPPANSYQQAASPAGGTQERKNIIRFDSSRGVGLRRVAAPGDATPIKRRKWLDNLLAYLQHRWAPGRARWEGEALISKARTEWPALTPDERKSLNDLNRRYREAAAGGWRPAAA